MHNENYKAFTLVELSIVLVIIGLIIGGITLGGKLKENSILRSIMKQITTYSQAYHLFKDSYNAMPGDILNATSYWSSSTNGNGDGIISTAEGYYSFSHLGSTCSNMIPETFAGGGATWIIGTNAPATAIPGVYFQLHRFTDNLYGRGAADWPVLVVEDSTARAFTPMQAYTIDKKMDDGKADGGALAVIKSWSISADATKCLSNSWLAATAGSYVFSDTQPNCRLVFLLEQRL
jgi:prepilin-type N-terminal cleavage/methylation domain-containing protein